MAEEHAQLGHPGNDYYEHEKTYKLFISFTKYGVVAIVIALLLLAFFTL